MEVWLRNIRDPPFDSLGVVLCRKGRFFEGPLLIRSAKRRKTTKTNAVRSLE
jgi:hypothetical protein